MILDLNLQEIDQVSGGGSGLNDSGLTDAAAGALIGASIGFLLGGPVGAAAFGYAGASIGAIANSVAQSRSRKT